MAKETGERQHGCHCDVPKTQNSAVPDRSWAELGAMPSTEAILTGQPIRGIYIRHDFGRSR